MPAASRHGAESALIATAQLPFAARTTLGPFCDGVTPFDICTLRSFSHRRHALKAAAKARADDELCNANYSAAAHAYPAPTGTFEADVGGGTDKPEFEHRYNVAREMSDMLPARVALQARMPKFTGDATNLYDLMRGVPYVETGG